MDSPSRTALQVHEKLTNSVQNDVEKQTSSQNLRVASIAVTRTGTYAGARAFGTQMDDHQSQPASDGADESLAWLDFLEECRRVLSLNEQSDPEQPANLTPELFETASRLRTRTARVLARVMITRLAERLATAPSPSKPVERAPLEVTNADSLLQSSAPAVIDPRVRTVLQYVESRHVQSACRLDDVARNLRVSRSYLSRLVFKETGVTFNRHLQLARMNTAARLLQESELSIKEISSGTGYEHVPSFDRQFRSHFNLTPGDFRRAVRLS
jgi:AraC-like DNA-binding protein